MKPKTLKLEINGKDYAVTITEFSAEDAVITVNNKEYKVRLKDLGIEQVSDLKPQPEVETSPSPVEESPPAKLHRPKSIAEATAIKAPLPGLILKILVKPGDPVKAGQNVLVMEAMKMENDIQSKHEGVVQEIKVREGESVEEGDLLVVLK